MMSITSTFPSQIPESTRLVGEAILDAHDLCVFLGQHLEELFDLADFADLYADSGRPSVHPILLAVVTILQFWEDWPDRQAGEQVVKRIDWKYGLRQELTWLGFHFSDLCHFRQRLLHHEASERVFERVLNYLTAEGYLKKRGKQRTDSTHVLAQVARLSRVELKWESLRMALEDLMSVQAGWVMATLGATFVQTYSQARATYRMSQKALHALETQLDTDSLHLLKQVESRGQAEWRQLPDVRLLAAVMQQQPDCLTPEDGAGMAETRQPATGRIDPIAP